MPEKPLHIVIVKRETDGRRMDIDKRTWDQMTWVDQEGKRRRNGSSSAGTILELIEEISVSESTVNDYSPRTVPVEEDPFECPLCGLVAENEGKLVMHKKEIHG